MLHSRPGMYCTYLYVLPCLCISPVCVQFSYTIYFLLLP